MSGARITSTRLIAVSSKPLLTDDTFVLYVNDPAISVNTVEDQYWILYWSAIDYVEPVSLTRHSAARIHLPCRPPELGFAPADILVPQS